MQNKDYDISSNWIVINQMITNQENASIGNLFLGNIWSAKSLEILNKYNIRTVLSICDFCDLNFDENNQINHFIIEAKDEPNYDLKQDIDKCLDLIDTFLQTSNILVHCQMGKSRSASIVIAYFMKKYQINFDSAYQQVLKLKPDIKPNNGFILQLKKMNFYQIKNKKY
ncbi:hypothetical protein ABPG74_013882 [Tetrahymena malaccensis]